MKPESGMYLSVDACDSWRGLIFFFLWGALNGVLDLMKYRKILQMGEYRPRLTRATEKNKQSGERKSMRKLQLKTVRRDLGNIWAELNRWRSEPFIPLSGWNSIPNMGKEQGGRGEYVSETQRLVWREWRERSRRRGQGIRGGPDYIGAWSLPLVYKRLGSIVAKSAGFGARSWIYALHLPLPSYMTSGKLLSSCFTICKMGLLSLPTSWGCCED